MHLFSNGGAATPQSVILVPSQAPKLLDQFRAAARNYGHTEAWAAEAADWCRQFILFHGKRHPSEMGLAEIGLFLEQLAKTENAPSQKYFFKIVNKRVFSRI